MEILIVGFVMGVIAMVVILVILEHVVRLYVGYLVHVGIVDLYVFLFFF